MLDFHLGTNSINKPGPHLGGLEIDELHWLQQNGFLPHTEAGPFSGNPIFLPYFEDCVLGADQVKLLYEQFIKRLALIDSQSGFRVLAVEKLGTILKTVVEKNEGLSTIAD